MTFDSRIDWVLLFKCISTRKTSLKVTRATEAAGVLNYDAQKTVGSQLRQSRFDNLMNTFLLRLFDI